MYNILTINPGSTSTKIAIFSQNTTLQLLAQENLQHSSIPDATTEKYQSFTNQLELCANCVAKLIKAQQLTKIDCIVARGGLVKPIAAGSYAIDEAMLDDLKHNRYGTHASNLGALIADELSKKFHCPAFITDPVGVDELNIYARYTGLPEIKRQALSHVLNIRATARLAAKELGLSFEQANFVVAHLGGGTSIVALENGRMTDTTNALDGGPFTPQRVGTLPTRPLVELAYSGKYKTANDLIHKLLRESGLYAHLGTASGKAIFERIANGDTKAKEVLTAMSYQIAQNIGAMATVLRGDVQAIIITGGLARPPLTDWIKTSTAWIAPIMCYPGEHEQEALAAAGARFLLGKEQLQNYSASNRPYQQ
jgi:butyrate kinase